jgi:hypothetical protein
LRATSISSSSLVFPVRLVFSPLTRMAVYQIVVDLDVGVHGDIQCVFVVLKNPP